MSRTDVQLNLDIDLQHGVVPISRAASSLASLLKRSREQQQPIVVTQKGYPAGVILAVDLYTALRVQAAKALEANPGSLPPDIEELSSVLVAELPAPGPEPVAVGEGAEAPARSHAAV